MNRRFFLLFFFLSSLLVFAYSIMRLSRHLESEKNLPEQIFTEGADLFQERYFSAGNEHGIFANLKISYTKGLKPHCFAGLEINTETGGGNKIYSLNVSINADTDGMIDNILVSAPASSRCNYKLNGARRLKLINPLFPFGRFHKVPPGEKTGEIINAEYRGIKNINDFKTYEYRLSIMGYTIFFNLFDTGEIYSMTFPGGIRILQKEKEEWIPETPVQIPQDMLKDIIKQAPKYIS